METMPVLSEFVQAGVVGICLALIVALGYIVRLFVQSNDKATEASSKLAVAVTELSTEVKEIRYQLIEHNKRLDDLEDRQNGSRGGG